MPHTHSLIDICTETIAACSLLHTMLPPWEAFNDYPKVQKAYKLLVYLVGWFALNARSTVYKSISTKEGAYTSCATQDPASPSNPINKGVPA